LPHPLAAPLIAPAPATVRVRATRFLQRLRRPGMRRAGLTTVVVSALVLVANLATGAILARSLGASGRGELSAIQVTAPFIAWLMGMGGGYGVCYYHARRPEQAATLVGTCAALVLPVGILGILVAEAVVRVTFASQPAAVRGTAHIYMLTIGLAVLGDMSFGVLLGDQDFGFYNLQRVFQPLATVVCYLGLHQTQHLSVASALVTITLVSCVAILAGTSRVLRRHGIARPSISLARATLWYGLRAHGSTVAGLANGRLDMIMLPAFVATSQIGLYAVATGVSGMIAVLAGTLSVLILPSAARHGGERQTRIVLRTMYASAAMAVALAICLAVVGPFAIRLVYGAAFAGSSAPMMVLLPGTVFLATGGILVQGLFAANRPLSGSLAQGAGLAFTLPGLFILLPHGGGIMAAAVVSSVSYFAVFLIAGVLFCRAVDIPLRQLVWPSARRRERQGA
jgi:O-antigen/teichoic acid export membrane protein